MKTVEKITALRQVMKSRGVAALVIPSSDPHQSEYVAPRWQGRQWISGFTGSAGTLVITARQARLWADGRYFLQAERELRGSGIRLFKLREPGVPSVSQWIAQTLEPGQAVAFDGEVFSVAAVRELRRALASKGIRVRTGEDLLERVWCDRPEAPQAPARDFPVKYAGQGRAAKLAAVRDHLRGEGADGLLLASLDDIAWLFNIRGGDGANSPVVLAYALVERKRAALFADPGKFSPSLRKALGKAGVRLMPYHAVARYLRSMRSLKSICLNPGKVSYAVAGAIPRAVRWIEEATDITTRLKSIKNPVELKHWRQAALVDGVALVRFFAWLDRALKQGRRMTEYGIAEELRTIRARAPVYRGESFDAICAYGGNAAMVHYSAPAEGAAVLKPRGLLLVDSGGQYDGGTMDTTRTVALGPVSAGARRSYTLVLKGFIALQMARFPRGRSGTHLDTLARAPLWAAGRDYKHGSGHGVGYYLNVHEGPCGFTPAWSPAPLEAGMVLTVEPGCYVEGKYGIRTENMVLVQEAGSTCHGNFLQFETLTLCPIDTAPLVPELLSVDERQWLNAYHRRVWQELAPHLDAPDRAWLGRTTKPLGTR